MNPVVNMLSKASQFGTIIQQVKAAMQSAQNPLQILQNNPQMGDVMKFIQSCGGNEEQAFYQLAKQKGVVDPAQVLDYIRSML